MTESVASAAERLAADAVLALARGDAEGFERAADRVTAGPGVDDWQPAAEHALADLLRRHTAAAWRRGWQPADVVHHARRSLGDPHADAAVCAVAAEARDYPEASVDERWRAQLDALGARVWWDGAEPWPRYWRERAGIGWPVAAVHLLELSHLLAVLPELPLLCPIPGRATRRTGPRPPAPAPGGAAGRRMVDRVRALLAKAESTEFPREAEVLTARAQELMARHSIDHALLADEPGAGNRPTGIRVPVDNPYEDSKAVLLEVVAEANHCRTVWHQDLGFSTVLGFGADTDAVELMYTSLLAQATAEMVRAGSGRPGGAKGRKARERTREFRRSFLAAYVQRVGERLERAARDAERGAAAESGTPDLLPVLAERDRAVEDAVDEMFPGLVRTRTRAVNDYEGWLSGLAEADRAPLRARPEVREGP
ncbi:DUF2786 domain-containing protein [Actinorugispora endophytica]|uniref:Uncharacterized protein DUF2786 n=1 Tax=Actinorugispora endophytica TaxID=1605990 RepID=A0A4R6UZP8_9ACTN|nr:DUF2786 domain-containing protein [Actinorugispora endophytica]TDQ51619.1 uncharacterized protein DUF2786 [Actinorugispora endophytica]